MHVKTGIEAEFFLLTPEGDQISDQFDTAAKPCYDQQAFMRRLDVIREISDYMLELGWGAYQNDHEDANGQWEMNWDFDDALTTADKHSLLSSSWPNRRRKTRLPRDLHAQTDRRPDRQRLPRACLGLGCAGHAAKVNVFAGRKRQAKRRAGLSEKGRHFLGGIMKHASALAAITNPTVNSYKRINAPRTMSGATWAPNTVTWTGNNRTHMVRVPGPGRFELRLPDGAVNPYLLQAVIIAAGLSGVRSKADPGKRHDIDMYAEGHKVTGAPKLPLNMLDAMREYDKDEGLKAAMGEEFSRRYLKMKMQEWNDSASISRLGKRQHAGYLKARCVGNHAPYGRFATNNGDTNDQKSCNHWRGSIGSCTTACLSICR